MAENNQPKLGFTLPQPSDGEKPATESSESTSPIAITIGLGNEGPSTRDLLIGGAVVLVLMVAFFFAKNAYATMLVGKRVQPRSANASGWWLLIFLTLLTVGVVLAVISRDTLMTPFIVGPLVLGALVALVLMLISGRR